MPKYQNNKIEEKIHFLESRISEKVNKYMEKMGWSGDEMSRKTGIPRQLLSNILVGQGISKISTAMKICHAIGIKFSDQIKEYELELKRKG